MWPAFGRILDSRLGVEHRGEFCALWASRARRHKLSESPICELTNLAVFLHHGHAIIKESMVVSCDGTDPAPTMRLSVRPRKDSSPGLSNSPKPSRWWQLRTSFANEPKASFAQFTVPAFPFANGLGRGIFRRIHVAERQRFSRPRASHITSRRGEYRLPRIRMRAPFRIVRS